MHLKPEWKFGIYLIQLKAILLYRSIRQVREIRFLGHKLFMELIFPLRLGPFNRQLERVLRSI